MRHLSCTLLAVSAIVLVGCQSGGTSSTSVFAPITMSENRDNAITEQVKSALSQSGAFTGLAINVVTEKGVVTLTGFVKTIRQYDTAVKITGEVAGVSGIQNHLVIRK